MHERVRGGATSEQERDGACAACGAVRGGERCDACGAPTAPGGYRVLRQLARGAHSRLYLAEKDGHRVALKELLFALVPDAAQLDAFGREAEVLRGLSHPRIPRLYASFSEGKGAHLRLYLAQEFVEGGSLQQELDAGRRYTEAEARAVAREVLEVLDSLHGREPRVLHRDLKPANLMRRADGSLAVVDFGSARDVVRGATHRHTLVGTYGYMPPEQMGGTVDATSDLYALGATLVHLVSGRPPDALMGPGMELSFAGTLGVSPRFEAFLLRLVERDRRERFASARAALEALDALERPEPVRAAPVRAQRPRHAGVWLTAGLAAALIAAGMLVFWAGARGVPDAAPVPAPPALPAPPQLAPPRAPEAPRLPAPEATRPQPAPPRTARPQRTDGVEVAEVITLPGAQRARPFLLARDVDIAFGDRDSVIGACGIVRLTEGHLQAEGGGTLQAPRSRLEVRVARERVAPEGMACPPARVELLGPDGAPLAPPFEVEFSRPGTAGSARHTFVLPRTLRAVGLRLDGGRGLQRVVRVDLTTGTTQAR